MITRRIIANLVAFGVVSLALIAYGFLDLLGNPLASQTTVSTVLPSASGLAQNFLVTLNGVDVGAVKSVSLAADGAKVTMTLNPGTHVPADVQAKVVIANALGEQEVELVPPAHDPPGVPVLHSGSVIAAAPDSEPASVGVVVAEATKLLQAIPPNDLNSLLNSLAVALNGNGGDLRTIASASALFSQEFLAYQQQFESLLANAPPVLDTVTANASQLQQGLADTVVLAKVLASHSGDLVRLLNQGSSAAQDLNALVVDNEPNLACLIHDAAGVTANLATAPNLGNLATALVTNQDFFGAVAAISPTGPAKALTSSDHARTDQEWLRTHLLIPPQEPSADAYSTPTELPAVLPGAACSTEFGQGVGAGLQPGFKPVGPNARVELPTAADAQVTGGGPVTPDATAAVDRVSDDGPATEALPVLAGLGVVGWMITLARRRRQARSARPLHLAARVADDKGRRTP